MLQQIGLTMYGTRHFMRGDHGSPVRASLSLPAHTARQRRPEQFAGLDRYRRSGRARVRVALRAQAIRRLAHHVPARESLVQGRRPRPLVRTVAAVAGRAHRARIRAAGQHQLHGASGCHRNAKKGGPKTISRSRDGCSARVPKVAEVACTDVTFSLSPGRAHDPPEGRALHSRPGAPRRPQHLLLNGPREATRPISAPSTCASCPSCHRSRPASRLGGTTARWTTVATRSNGYSDARWATDAPSRTSRNST